MKKVVLTLLITALVGGGAFAQLSLGVGAGYTADFQKVDLTKAGKQADFGSDYFDINYAGITFNTYVDFTYVMFSANLGFLNQSYPNADMKEEEKDTKTTWSNLDLGLYIKFPFNLSKSGLVFFPMLGADYRMVLDVTATTGAVSISMKKMVEQLGLDVDLADMNSLWFKAGLGLDIPLGVQLYLRSSFLYGIGLISKFDKEMLDKRNEPDKIIDSVFNHGFDIKLALGFKF